MESKSAILAAFKMKLLREEIESYNSVEAEIFDSSEVHGQLLKAREHLLKEFFSSAYGANVTPFVSQHS